MGSNRLLRRAFGELDITKQDRAKLIPAVLGFMINGVQTVDVPNRPGYVYARIRSNINEMVQVFNDKVSPVYDLPVLLVRDPNNPVRYKVDGRDVGRYENWGSSSSYLPKHGNQHSFNTSGNGGGDVTWIYSQQITPWLVSPSGTFGSNGVQIHGHSRYAASSLWDYWGGTGTSSILVYKPTGTYARMVLVSFDSSGNPRLTPGSTQFDTSFTGTASILDFLPDLPENDIPLAGVLLVSGTSVILWDNIYDLRPFFTGIGGGGAVSTGTFSVYEDSNLIDGSVSALNFIGANVTAMGSDRVDVMIPHKGEFIRHWDQSENTFVYYSGTTVGLQSALTNVRTGDILYLPDIEFTGVSGSVISPSIGFAMIGVNKSNTGQGTKISCDHLGPIMKFGGGGVDTYLKDIYFSAQATHHTGTVCAVDAGSGSITFDNVRIRAYNLGSGSAVAVRNADSSLFVGGVVAEASSAVNGVVYPPITRTNGKMVRGSYIAVIGTSYVTVAQQERVGYPTDYIEMGQSGTLSFVGAADLILPFVTGSFSVPPTESELSSTFGPPASRGKGFLTTLNVSGTSHYLVSTDGASWFYTSMTKAV